MKYTFNLRDLMERDAALRRGDDEPGASGLVECPECLTPAVLSPDTGLCGDCEARMPPEETLGWQD